MDQVGKLPSIALFGFDDLNCQGLQLSGSKFRQGGAFGNLLLQRFIYAFALGDVFEDNRHLSDRCSADSRIVKLPVDWRYAGDVASDCCDCVAKEATEIDRLEVIAAERKA